MNNLTDATIAVDTETAGSNAPESTLHNSYSEVFWHWPGDFEGFEEFVQESRKESGYGREPPSWW